MFLFFIACRAIAPVDTATEGEIGHDPIWYIDDTVVVETGADSDTASLEETGIAETGETGSVADSSSVGDTAIEAKDTAIDDADTGVDTAVDSASDTAEALDGDSGITIDTGADSDTATIIDSGESELVETGDTGSVVEVDSTEDSTVVPEDTAVEDTAVDTAVLVDSGIAEDTGDSGEVTCAFSATVWDVDGTDGETYPESMYDEVTMENELIVELSSDSPSGEVTVGYVEVFRVDFTAVHAECPDVTVTGAQLSAFVTDSAETAWYEDLFTTEGFDQVDFTTAIAIGGSIVEGSGRWYDTRAIAYLSMNEFSVPAGTTVTVSWYADVTGASAADDDEISMDIEPSSGVWWTDGVTEVGLFMPRLEGNIVWF